MRHFKVLVRRIVFIPITNFGGIYHIEGYNATMGLLVDFLRWVPGYFFPKQCLGCGKEGWWVCPMCLPTVKRVLDYPICPECTRPSALGVTHPGCRRPLGLDGLINFYRYDGWAKLMMHGAKFQSPPRRRPLQDLSEEFAPLLESRLYQVLGTRYQPLIVPVPLHWWRERKRGYNQAALIAKTLASALQLPVNKIVVGRTRYALPQTLLDVPSDNLLSVSISRRIRAQASARRKNVRGAFSIRKGHSIPVSVLLVDDVWTSGATMTECCKTLKRAGAKWVWGVTLFRA